MIIPPVMLVAMVDEHLSELMRQAADYRRAREATRHRRALRRPNSHAVACVQSGRPRSIRKSLDNGPSPCVVDDALCPLPERLRS